MRCVHGVRIDKPCPDCEYEDNCRHRGIEPQNRPQPAPTHCTYPSCPCFSKGNCIRGGNAHAY